MPAWANGRTTSVPEPQRGPRRWRLHRKSSGCSNRSSSPRSRRSAKRGMTGWSPGELWRDVAIRSWLNSLTLFRETRKVVSMRV
eukprot:48597-Eustigmatos_ZCMA.PRE.2